MLVFEENSSENLVSANHFFREREPWAPMQPYNNGLDDLYGLLYISGDHNSIIANHISESLNTRYLTPAGATPVIIRVVSGQGNYISDNHIVATTEASLISESATDSCFSAQVSALLATEGLTALNVTTVRVETESVKNTILDSGSDAQVVMDKTVNAFRATPTPAV